MLIFLQFSIVTRAVVTSSRHRPFRFHNFVFLLNCLFVLYRVTRISDESSSTFFIFFDDDTPSRRRVVIFTIRRLKGFDFDDESMFMFFPRRRTLRHSFFSYRDRGYKMCSSFPKISCSKNTCFWRIERSRYTYSL